VEQINVFLIEDDHMIRESLAGLLRKVPGVKFLGSNVTVEEFIETPPSIYPDILLLDIGLKNGMSGLEGIRPIKKLLPNLNIIMLTTFDDSDRIFKALCNGATAYLTKRTSFPKILDAIQSVYRGGSYMSPTIARKVVNYFAPSKKSYTLTPRQSQIVEGVVQGLSYKMIASQLLITTETVRDHIKKIYKKLEIHSKAELIKKNNDGELK
jgi:DNA-binding NarL/FixJ family response regulator